jgi:hypothetical protein
MKSTRGIRTEKRKTALSVRKNRKTPKAQNKNHEKILAEGE